jgi:hypothetical protein
MNLPTFVPKLLDLMKKIQTLRACLLFAVPLWVWADPHDCMTREEAETLAKKIMNQYIIDYCDCCDSANPDTPKLYSSAKLLYIKEATIVPCSYDEGRFSVKITYNFGGAFDVEKGILNGKNLAKAPSKDVPVAQYVSLNYHFYLKNGKPDRLYGLLDQKPSYGTCDGLNRFPSAKECKYKDYKEFLAKNR